jgi:hypothetical protein
MDAVLALAQSLRREIFYVHHHVSVVEGHSGGRRELERYPTGADFLDREMNGPGTDLEDQRQAHFPEARIGLLDPILEAIGIKGAHVSRKDEMDEVSDRLPLLFGSRMHLDHGRF